MSFTLPVARFAEGFEALQQQSETSHFREGNSQLPNSRLK